VNDRDCVDCGNSLYLIDGYEWGDDDPLCSACQHGRMERAMKSAEDVEVNDETTPEPEPAKTRLDLLADVVRAQLRIVATLQDLNPTQRLQVIRWINDNHETLIDLDSANNQQRHEHAGDDDE
jgi:hypothetical protein